MNKIIVLLFSGLMMLGILSMIPASVPVHAQVTGPNGCTTDCANQGLNDISQAFPQNVRQQRIQDLVHTVINWALYIAAILAVIMIIYGGFQYIFSGGDAARATKGRTTLVNALIGLAIVVLSYVIVQVIYNFLTGR